MMTALFSLTPSALQQAAAGAESTLLGVAADVSMVVIAAILAILLVVALLFLVQLKKLLGSIQQQVQPVTDRARVAAENVEYVSAVVREDVQKIRGSVSGLSEKLKDASERMEERVEEFNALMDVVQDEAEAVLLDTASVVRGVRAGAQTMSESVVGGAPRERTKAPTPPEDRGESGDAKDGGESGAGGDEDGSATGDSGAKARAKESPESG